MYYRLRCYNYIIKAHIYHTGDCMSKWIVSSISIVLIVAVISTVYNIDTTNNTVFTSAIINSDITVIIDAGHGGFDGGCSGIDGTLEKDINLEISLKLNTLLQGLGFNTVLIRDTDTAVNTIDGTIREKKVSDIKFRYSIMSKYPNSVYLCIHQNQYSSASVNGAQVFYSPNDELSVSLAKYIQSNIAEKVQIGNSRKVKKCTDDVYLIHNATTYAVLIECGFLSNQNDLNSLKSNEYQQKLCFSIAGGLIDWMNSN